MATSIVETITPQKAQEYLAKSGGNRIVLICKDPEQCLWDSKTMVKYEERKEK